MTLPDYIRQIGEAKAATVFGVKQRTVKSWREGARQPRPLQAAKIEDITHGIVSFRECYPDTIAPV